MITPSRSPALRSPSRSRRLVAGALLSLVAWASGCAKEAEDCLGSEADGGEGGYESVVVYEDGETGTYELTSSEEVE